MTQFYTYLHCKPNGDPFYVGKGLGKRSHVFTSGRNKHHQRIVAKHGRENIGVFVFPCDTEAQAHADEIQQIAQLRREGYELSNKSSGGEGGMSGVKTSPETRARMSASNQLRGKKLSSEHRAKFSAAQQHRAPYSAERLAKMSIAMKGRTLSSDHRAKISAARKGMVFTEDHRSNMSIANKGKKITTETRKKMSAAHLGKIHSDEARANMIGHIKSKETCNKLSVALKNYWAEKKGGKK